MTTAIKSWEKRHTPPKDKSGRPAKGRSKPKDGTFNKDEQEHVKASWEAIMDHMDKDVVLAAPDFALTT